MRGVQVSGRSASLKRRPTHVGVALLLLLSAGVARADVTRVEIARRADVGASGYEKIVGTIYFAVDPKDPHNRVVVDLEKAPVNRSGRVEFSSDLYILRPKAPRGNGAALVEVLNRGRKVMLDGFNRSVSPDPEAESELGDGFLMRFGYTLVWVGWEFDLEDPPPAMRIHLPGATDRGGANPRAGGLGLVAIRDTATWLKHQPDALAPVRYVYGFGSSQGGRFLRSFMYEGFNTDERDRQVLDAVFAHVAGASRIGLNARTTSIGLDDNSAAAFPFADASVRDPVSGAQEGLLDNARMAGHAPKVFYTNTPVEYWGSRAAALVHTNPAGTADLPLPENVRVYFLAGTQHLPSRFPPAVTNGQQTDNPVDYWWTMRALLVAMHKWVKEGVAPPASQYPRLEDGTLVPVASVAFPAIPGIASPRSVTAADRLANPLLPGGAGGGVPLPLLVPQVDEDGNERAGIRLPDVAVPLGTYTGWNFRQPAIGAPDELVSLLGSSIPFSATRAAREAAKDPRKSIEERYRSRDEYLARVEQVLDALVLKGYLIYDDGPRIKQRAEDQWDLATERPPAPKR
jgi:hypothetical protein